MMDETSFVVAHSRFQQIECGLRHERRADFEEVGHVQISFIQVSVTNGCQIDESKLKFLEQEQLVGGLGYFRVRKRL